MPQGRFRNWVTGYADRRVREEARNQGVPEDYAARQHKQETGGDPDVILGHKKSKAGAIGAMQLMPGTARDLGVDPYDVDQNIVGGVRYSKQMLDQFGGDRRLAAAAYNAGPGRVRKAGGVPNIPETQHYADVVGGPAETAQPAGRFEQWKQQAQPRAEAWKSNTPRPSQQNPGAYGPDIPNEMLPQPSKRPVQAPQQPARPMGPRISAMPSVDVRRPLTKQIQGLRTSPFETLQQGMAQREQVLPETPELQAKRKAAEEFAQKPVTSQIYEEAKRVPGRLMTGLAQTGQRVETIGQGLVRGDVTPLTATGAQLAGGLVTGIQDVAGNVANYLQEPGTTSNPAAREAIQQQLGRFSYANAEAVKANARKAYEEAARKYLTDPNALNYDQLQQVAAQEAADAATRQTTAGNVTRAVGDALPAVALGAVGGLPAALGTQAAMGDIERPLDTAVNMASTAVPMALTRAARPMLNNATQAMRPIPRTLARTAGEMGVGAAGNVGQSLVTQPLLTGKIDPNKLAEDAAVGAAFGISDAAQQGLADRAARRAQAPPSSKIAAPEISPNLDATQPATVPVAPTSRIAGLRAARTEAPATDGQPASPTGRTGKQAPFVVLDQSEWNNDPTPGYRQSVVKVGDVEHLIEYDPKQINASAASAKAKREIEQASERRMQQPVARPVTSPQQMPTSADNAPVFEPRSAPPETGFEANISTRATDADAIIQEFVQRGRLPQLTEIRDRLGITRTEAQGIQAEIADRQRAARPPHGQRPPQQPRQPVIERQPLGQETSAAAETQTPPVEEIPQQPLAAVRRGVPPAQPMRPNVRPSNVERMPRRQFSEYEGGEVRDYYRVPEVGEYGAKPAPEPQPQSADVLPFRRRPPAPTAPRRPLRTAGPSDKSAVFPREQRNLVRQGRVVEEARATGTEGKGPFGRFAQQVFRSTVPDGEKGITSFYESPNVKGALGLDADASAGETRQAFKNTFARMMKVNADEVSLTQVPQWAWDAWMRRNASRLGAEDRRRYQQTIQNTQDIERAKAINESIQASDTERPEQSAGSVQPDARSTGNRVAPDVRRTQSGADQSGNPRTDTAKGVSREQQRVQDNAASNKSNPDADFIHGLIPDTGTITRDSLIRESGLTRGRINPALEALKQQGRIVEEGNTLRRAGEVRAEEVSQPGQQKVRHDNPAISGKPIIAETADGRFVVANPENKTGVSIVKGKQGKFSSTQVNLPDAVAEKMRALGEKIPDADLTEDGRETESHITVKYGLHDEDPAKIQQILAGEPPVRVRLGKTSLFENEDADVVKVDVDSPDLQRLNKKIADAMPHTDTHPDYKPHATIAYVKPGTGKKYAGLTDLEGQEVTLDRLLFSSKNGVQTEIKLQGESSQSSPSKATQPAQPKGEGSVASAPRVNPAQTPARKEKVIVDRTRGGDMISKRSAEIRAKKMGPQWRAQEHPSEPGKYRVVRDLTPQEWAEEARRDAEYEAKSKPVAEASAQSVERARTNVEAHADLFDRIEKGQATAAEIKASFEALATNKEAIKAELSKLTKDGIFEKFPDLRWRYKNETKAEVVDAAFREMQSDYTLNQSFNYGMGDDSYTKGIRAVVEKHTDESLSQYAEKVKQAAAEREQKKKAALEGMEDPKTLEDFNRVIRAKAAEIGEGVTFQQVRMSLTPEQRAQYDELAATKSRDERRARADQQRTEVRAASQSMTGDVIETKHTKTGEPLFVVKAAERVERDVYNQWNATAKRLGGWYSSYRAAGAVPGFQFKTRANAEAFLEYLGGKVDKAKETVQARRDAMQDDKSQTAVERLREMADALDARADESLSVERKANTDRRARFAASAESAANASKAMAKTMRNIADAIEAGKAKFLDRVRQKVQVEMLQSFVHSGQGDYLRSKYPTYAEQEKHFGEPPTKEAADHATFPTYTAYRSDLAKLGRQLIEQEGTKKLGAAILKEADDVTDAYLKFAKENVHKVSTFSRKDGERAVFGSKATAEAAIARSGFKGQAIVLPFKRGQNLIILSPSAARERGIWAGDNDKRITLGNDIGDELVAKLKTLKRREIDVPWTFESAYDKRKRLAGMGIETPAELRAALREFIGLREQAKAPDKIKEMERAMIGRKNDGLDFFPTPASVADRMIEVADVKEGMAVLEPSAGMGHIADRLREAGVDPDVVEMASDRRELLEAKGHNLVGQDFLETQGQYDRIVMNPPFSNRRDIEHVRHAYDLLKPEGRLVAIMGEGSFFGSDKKATEFREWLESVGGTSEKLEPGSFLDPSLPVNTGVNARMVVIEKPAGAAPAQPQPVAEQVAPHLMTPAQYKAAGLGPANDAEVLKAARKGQPVNAEAVDTYRLKDSLPQGYRRQGDVYAPVQPVAEQAPPRGEVAKPRATDAELRQSLFEEGDYTEAKRRQVGLAEQARQFSPTSNEAAKELKQAQERLARAESGQVQMLKPELSEKIRVENAAEKEKIGKTGLTPTQEQYLRGKIKEAKPMLAEGRDVTIPVPGDGRFTLRGPQEARALESRLDRPKVTGRAPLKGLTAPRQTPLSRDFAWEDAGESSVRQAIVPFESVKPDVATNGNIATGKKFVTDGHLVIRAEGAKKLPPAMLKKNEDSKVYKSDEDLETHFADWNKQAKRPLKIEGVMYMGDQKTPYAFLTDAKNQVTAADAAYLRAIMDAHAPDEIAQAGKDNTGVLVFRKNGQPVAALMPMRTKNITQPGKEIGTKKQLEEMREVMGQKSTPDTRSSGLNIAQAYRELSAWAERRRLPDDAAHDRYLDKVVKTLDRYVSAAERQGIDLDADALFTRFEGYEAQLEAARKAKDGIAYRKIQQQIAQTFSGREQAKLTRDADARDTLRSPLSNLNYIGTYEKLGGAAGKAISEAFKDAQVELARNPQARNATLDNLAKTVKPYQQELRLAGKPQLANYIEAHLDAVRGGNEPWSGLANFLTKFNYYRVLAYNPRSAAVNWLQPFQTLWPHLTTREFAKVMADARRPEIRARLKEIAEKESGGQVEGIEKRGPWTLFGTVSDSNRIVGHLAGELMADKLGLTGQEKARMAADWAAKVEFDNGRFGAPPLFREPLARVLLQFKGYTVKNLERIWADAQRAPQGSETGKLARISKMVVSQVAVGGVRSISALSSIPGIIILGTLAKTLEDKLPPEDKHLANKIAEGVYFGAPALLEQDLSSSMMLLDAPFGKTPKEKALNAIGGPTVGLMAELWTQKENYDNAKTPEKRNNALYRAAKAVTPYTKTAETVAALAQGKRPTMQLGRQKVPMTALETAGYGLMGTPLRQTRFYEDQKIKEAQKKAGRPVMPRAGQ